MEKVTRQKTGSMTHLCKIIAEETFIEKFQETEIYKRLVRMEEYMKDLRIDNNSKWIQLDKRVRLLARRVAQLEGIAICHGNTVIAKIEEDEIIERLCQLEQRVFPSQHEVVDNSPPDESRAGHPWNEFEDDDLKRHFNECLNVIARRHGRTAGAIKSRLRQEGFLR